MTLIDISPRLRPISERERIEAVISEYGVMRVLRAMMIVTIRKRPRRVARAYGHDLPNYIRRDIGAPEQSETPGYLRHLL